MAFYDIREFIDKLKETSDIVFVEQEVGWNLEMGAIIRRSNETRSPAPFFQKIKDYPPGYRLFGAPFSTFRRLAIAFDLEPDTPCHSGRKGLGKKSVLFYHLKSFNITICHCLSLPFMRVQVPPLANDW